MAKRILIAECVLAVAVAVGMTIREIPGIIREIRMWRMARLRKPSTLRTRAQAAPAR